MATRSNQPPTHTIRAGVISVSIWQQTGKNGDFFTVNVQRSYKDESDEWAYSESFSRDESLVAANLLTLAHNWIIREQAKQAKHEDKQA